VRVRADLWPRLIAVGLLMISLNALLMMYGLRFVGSGLASIISAALTPLSLLGFAVALGQERWTGRQTAAMGVGLCGILVLFGPDAFSGAQGMAELFGAALQILGCLCYSAGSVLARPLMRSLTAPQLGGFTNLVGGVLLLVFSIPFEPGAREALAFDWGVAAWSAWAFLLAVSSLGATMIYFTLIRDWGPSRTGTYAFVSPVIAVLLGTMLNGERLALQDAIGMVLTLGAAAIALHRPAKAAHAAPPPPHAHLYDPERFPNPPDEPQG
jgi:drug/metabolite transporter (DMT)-like permease